LKEKITVPLGFPMIREEREDKRRDAIYLNLKKKTRLSPRFAGSRKK